MVLQNSTLATLLKKAKELEKKYEWLQASQLYKKAAKMTLEDNDLINAAKLLNNMSYCYFRAGLQAKTKTEFKERMSSSIQASQIASKHYKQSNNPRRLELIKNSLAMVAYVKSWLEVDPVKTKLFVDEWWTHKSEVLKSYEKDDDKIAISKTCNDMLEGSFHSRYWIGSNEKDLKEIREKLISLGERAIAILKDGKHEKELARAYCWTGIYCVLDNTRMTFGERHREKEALVYSKKALELSQKIGDAWLTGWSYSLASNAADRISDLNSVIELLNFQIEQGKISKDNFLLSNGQSFLVLFSFIYSLHDEDPEKNLAKYKQNLQIAEGIIHLSQIINYRVFNSYYIACVASIGLALLEIDNKEKYAILTKAVEYGRKGVDQYRGWNHPMVKAMFNIFSWSIFELSKIESDVFKKKILLEELLKNTEKSGEFLKAYPSDYYFRAYNQNWVSLGKFNLSILAKERKEEISLLREAVFSMETCIELTKKDLNASSQIYLFSRYGGLYYWFGGILDKLYSLIKDRSVLNKAVKIYDDAITLFVKSESIAGVVESYWQKAIVLDKLAKYLEAAEDYERSSNSYLEAAQKIPQLKDFFENHSQYMKAWSQIKQARYNHSRENYAQAKKHYREAAFLHEKSNSWSYLAPNYYAWEQLETGENLSREEKPSKAVKSFKLAKECFKKSETSIKKEIASLDSVEEKNLANNLIRASSLRYRYCNARISLEEAKIFDKIGDYTLSSKKYKDATEVLKEIVNKFESEEEIRELRLLTVLSQAWEKMALAESKKSAKVFIEAAELFENAKDISISEKTSLWALGNSCFCRGLAAGITYQSTVDLNEHARAKQLMKSAATNYLRAGFKNASEFAKATQRLFDAYAFMNQAENELDQEKRAKQYQMADNLLQIAAGSFTKARHPEKTAQVEEILTNVREEKALAISLSQVMQVPSIASTTQSFAAPRPSSEASVGLEKFDHANVQANLITHLNEVKVGESFCLSVEFVNAGKEPALLTRIEDFVPPDFIVINKPEIYRLEESCLNMKGKQIAPLKLVEAKVVIQPSKKGVYQLKPTVHYLDELGQNKSLKLKPVEIKVEEVILADRISTGTKELDSLLLGGIPEEYAVVLTGSPSDERELIIKNFLEAGTKEGQISFYVTTEADGTDNLLEKSSFYLFLCNPKPKVEVPDLPNVTRLRSKTDLTNLNIALLKAYRNVEQSPNKRACINIISDVLVDHGVKTTRKWIAELTTDLVSKGFTVLTVMNPNMHPPDQATGVIDLFDGEISITQTDDLQECKKSIQVRKLRGQQYIKNPICLSKS